MSTPIPQILNITLINQLRNAPDKHSLKTRRYLCSLDKQYLLDRLKQ